MLSGIDKFKLTEEMQNKINALHDSDNTGNKRQFTKEQDYIILNYYMVKNKEELAELLGCDRGTLRKRYKELKK